MKEKNKNKFRYLLSFMLVLSILFTIPLDNYSYGIKEKENKKALVFIMDELSLEDLDQSNLENISRLKKRAGQGLINVRSKSSASNTGSRFLSLGMGVRTLASPNGNLAFERDEVYSVSKNESIDSELKASELYKVYLGESPEGEVLNIGIQDIKDTALRVSPNNEVGLLGKICRENNVKIGVLGNSDVANPNRDFTLMAMDEKGAIPYGSISSDLLTKDQDTLGGLKFKEDKLLEEFDRISEKSDLIFIDYGDSTRIQRSNRLSTEEIRQEQKEKTLKEADRFLGQLLDRLDLDKDLFILMSANPSKEMIGQGNFGLTPIFLSRPGLETGLLQSSTTNRRGLVTNFDFAPTILDYFDIDYSSSYIGESMESLKNENTMDYLKKIEDEALYLRRYRKVFHWIYIGLIAICLLGYYLSIFTAMKTLSSSILSYLSLTIIGLPITMMTVSRLGYRSIVFDLIYVFLGAFILALVLKNLFKSDQKAISFLSLTTAVLILLDSFIFKELMIVSPLGSDAIAGGRFYGIGNDYMGILLGSSLLGLFSIFQARESKRSTILALLLPSIGLITLALTPLFGANMGGTLSAMAILLIAILILYDKRFSLRKLFLLVLSVVGFILLVALLDSRLNPNPTHAGKALQALFTGGGMAKLVEIISIKLRQVFWNLFNASWNIIFFGQIILGILLYKFKKDQINYIKENYNTIYKGFLIILLGSLFIFMFNDTGTIAAALIMTYVYIPLAMILKNKEAIKNK